eukprot:CAMPEP_0202701136 /NCGR_PEP_ID=MMETSP1385-20130828/14249_1 /ASSEMBLY_ACC=CAM_ASM_000861 /TAXON_ID=933848 /ORGANISM="Elphidium margaritaceum" /LENGTH=71 /DNA_ID=CAMNT_0049358487 /DNA_START=162 /DNA_END=377 /DNA_ORIENTATION=+
MVAGAVALRNVFTHQKHIRAPTDCKCDDDTQTDTQPAFEPTISHHDLRIFVDFAMIAVSHDGFDLFHDLVQ